MGYYTTYSISAVDQRPLANRTSLGEEFFSSLGLGYSSEVYRKDDGRFLVAGGEQLKWYHHDEHMIEASSKNKGIVLILDGEGEDQGDVWCKFYLNGKLVHEWQPESPKPPEWNEDWVK